MKCGLSEQWISRLQSFGFWCHVVWLTGTIILEGPIASNLPKYMSQKTVIFAQLQRMWKSGDSLREIYKTWMKVSIGNQTLTEDKEQFVYTSDMDWIMIMTCFIKLYISEIFCDSIIKCSVMSKYILYYYFYIFSLECNHFFTGLPIVWFIMDYPSILGSCLAIPISFFSLLD